MARTMEEAELLHAVEDAWVHLFMATGMGKEAIEKWTQRALRVGERLAKAQQAEDLVRLAVNLGLDVYEQRKALRALARGESWSPQLEPSAAAVLKAACQQAIDLLNKGVEPGDGQTARLVIQCVQASDVLRGALRATSAVP